MNPKKIKEFISLAKEAGVSELKYESDGEKYYVNFQATATQIVHQPIEQTLNASKEVKLNIDSNLKEITSPFVGTFYISASPDSDPYVKIGDKISAGSAMCIVEAMKIMNEIESDISGEVVEICVENETFVEFGQVLFRVKA